MGIAEAVQASLRCTDVPSDLRPLLLQNVVLTGGCCMFPGFKERIQNDLTGLLADDLSPVTCHCPSSPLLAPYHGGCELVRAGHLPSLGVTRREYQEHGGDGLCRTRIWQDLR